MDLSDGLGTLLVLLTSVLDVKDLLFDLDLDLLFDFLRTDPDLLLDLEIDFFLYLLLDSLFFSFCFEGELDLFLCFFSSFRLDFFLRMLGDLEWDSE